tara:strand:+ start:1840 stop:2250 length:411 start_codon:yes stop_codon:yes gene_type:complete
MDVHDKKTRSKNMAAIKGKDTKPELAVRKYLHNKGLRYTLHNKELPGKPDLTLKRYNSVVFVNSCFWHRHKKCKKSVMPKSNTEFWRDKLEKNVARDKKNIRLLKKQGWNVLLFWECELESRKLSNLYQSIVNQRH